MSFGNSAGVYPRIIDRSFIVGGTGLLAGGIVLTAKRGPTRVVTVTSPRDFTELFGMPTRDNPSMHSALRFLRRAGVLSVRRVIKDALAAGAILEDATSNPVLTFTAENEGLWGNAVEIKFRDNPDEEDVFTILVYDGKELVESFRVSRNPEAKDGYGNNLYIENVVNVRSRYIRVVDSPVAVITKLELVAKTVNLVGGTDDTLTPDTGEIIQAWEEFKNVDAIPAQLLINGGFAIPAIQVKMVEVAETRGDAVAILDVPLSASESVTDMVDFRKTTLMVDNNLAALYGGWLRVYDEYLDQEIVLPPSGDIAGVIVHTTEVAERWDAPAGLQRGIIPNVLGVTRTLNEGDRDQLYIAGINPITPMGGAAAVVWGQKNLQKAASTLDRMNTILSVIWMRNLMAEALQPYVFQGNTEFTRNSINYTLSSFLSIIQTRGGLYGYQVDTESDNTPEVIDRNELIVNVFIKPTQTAEFIRLNVVITPTGVTFE